MTKEPSAINFDSIEESQMESPNSKVVPADMVRPVDFIAPPPPPKRKDVKSNHTPSSVSFDDNMASTMARHGHMIQGGNGGSGYSSSTVGVSGKGGGVSPVQFTRTKERDVNESMKIPPVQALSFTNVPNVSSHRTRRVVEPSDVFGTKITSQEQQAFDTIEMQHKEIYVAHMNDIRRQVMQLLPLSVEIVSNWGANTTAKFVTFSGAVTKLIHQITTADGNAVLDAALKSAQYNKNEKSLLGKLMSKREPDLLGFKPHIVVLRANLSSWVTECSKLIVQSHEHNTKLSVKMITLATVADISKPIQDTVLDNAISNRRMTAQQLVQQSMLLDMQLKQIHGQLVDQMARADQLLTVTIPAFENVKANTR